MPDAKPVGRSSGGGASVAIGHQLVGDPVLPALVLDTEFSATGTTAAVGTPAGVLCTLDVRVFAHGAPSAAVIVVEGSVDGATWTALPGHLNVNASLNAARYTSVRIRATITGGTSPTVTVIALVAP